MTQNEEQAEELEVLRAIYEDDELFNEVCETTFQYRFGELGENKSFVLEVHWSDTYPECLPDINLDAFYNKHISQALRETIVQRVRKEIADSVGMAMTFTIFSWVGENFEELMEDQADAPEVKDEAIALSCHKDDKVIKEKKVQLTKQQKKKLADRTNYKGERERGWNWVDVVKHLSKTGSKEDK